MFRALCCMNAAPARALDAAPEETPAIAPAPAPAPVAAPVPVPAYPTRAQQPRTGLPARPGERPVTAFGDLSIERKISWLTKAAPPLKPDEYPNGQRIVAGKRHWSRKEALCNALELSMEAKRHAVPELCRQLLDEYPAEGQTFLLFGVPFPRARLVDWARDGIRAGQEHNPPPEIRDLGAELYRNNSQNVHANSVIIALANQLLKIQAQVPETSRVTDAAVPGQVKECIAGMAGLSQQTKTNAQSGLNVVSRRTDQVGYFSNSVNGCLAVLWNYICTQPDPALKRQLEESMVAKLAEISRENPCAIGMIERIIDIPTAIDWSITDSLSVEHLRLELQALAADISTGFEEEIADLMAVIRIEQGGAHIDGDPEAHLSGIKRERFLQMADIEYGILRQLDRAVVAQEAKKIFPEDLVL